MSEKPWHQHCLLRDDVGTGKMTLAITTTDAAYVVSMFARHGSIDVRLKGSTSKNGASETPDG